jgi:hypothetical protein
LWLDAGACCSVAQERRLCCGQLPVHFAATVPKRTQTRAWPCHPHQLLCPHRPENQDIAEFDRIIATIIRGTFLTVTAFGASML